MATRPSSPDDPAIRLQRLLRKKSREDFAWGRNDCALFAADCVLALTGIDHAAEFRGRYSTEIGAWRVLRRAGIHSLEALVDRYLDRLSEAERACRGDILLMAGPVDHRGRKRDFLAVCTGRDAVGPSLARGLDRAPLTIRKIAWRVSCLS